MAFVAGKSTRVLVNERSFSAKLRRVGWTHSRAYGEATAFGDDGDKFIPGLRSGSLTLEGMFEGVDGVDGELFTGGLTASDNGFLATVAPEGFAVGKRTLQAVGDVQGYNIPASVSETVGFTVDCMPDDGVDEGVSLHDLTAETATANGTSVDNAASSADGGVGVLHVTAASGGTPSATVKIQHSVDAVAWVDLVTFTAATAATSERKVVSGTVNRHVRAQWTIAGTTPSFTFVVAFARR